MARNLAIRTLANQGEEIALGGAAVSTMGGGVSFQVQELNLAPAPRNTLHPLILH